MERMTIESLLNVPYKSESGKESSKNSAVLWYALILFIIQLMF